MRCFVAVELAPELTSKVTELQEGLTGMDLKTVEPENLHFTLKFLGEVDVKTIDEVSRRLRKLAAEIKPLDIIVENLGVFPNENFVRVLWVGAPELLNLHILIENELAGLFKKDKPIPHLTIARVRSSNPKLVQFISKNKNVHVGKMRVDRIKLKKSTVTWKGPVYEDLASFTLEGGK